MAAISSLGIGSGIDLNGMLTKLMQVEQMPLVALQTKEASYQARISALGSLKGSLASLQTAAKALVPSAGQTTTEKYASYSATVGDKEVATATAKSGAVTATYSLEVTALAKTHRLVTPTPGTPAASPYSSATSAIGTGTLKIEVGTLSGGTFTADGAQTIEVEIGASNATLGGLRDAINAKQKGVTATIVTGSAGAQLVLTSPSTGTKNVMRMSGLAGFDYDPVANTGTMTQDAAFGGQAAQDAAFKLNGIAATSSTNSVTSVLDGVTLNLLKTNTGTPTTLTVTKDANGPLKASLSALVKAFNDAAKAAKDMGGYDATTKAAGALQGEAIVRTVQSQLRNLVFSGVENGTSNYKRLSDIGITFAKDGSLSLDDTKLTNAIKADFQGVSDLATALGKAFDKGMETLVGTTGGIAGATDSLNRMIKDIGNRRTVLNSRLTDIEARYRKQFSALDSLVASMNQTSTYLAQQLANLPSFGG